MTLEQGKKPVDQAVPGAGDGEVTEEDLERVTGGGRSPLSHQLTPQRPDRFFMDFMEEMK